PTNALLNELVERVETKLLHHQFGNANFGVVDRRCGVGIDDEKGVLIGCRFGGRNLDIGETELSNELSGRLLRAFRAGHRKRKRKLNHPVVSAIAIGAQPESLRAHNDSSASKKGLK